MRTYFCTILLIFTFISGALAYPDVAVVPYKISNPSSDFNEDTGAEYAKLISIAAIVKKGIAFNSHSHVKAELKQLSLDPQRTITEDDLQMLGRSGTADYILTGTLSRSKGSYISHSILYQIREKTVISKSDVKAESLLKLAEKDMQDTFFSFPDDIVRINPGCIDAAFLIDMSYKTSKEWSSIRDSVKSFANAVSEDWSIDTNISIIPYSETYSPDKKIESASSLPQLNNSLKALKPAGSDSQRIFEKAVKYAAESLTWRRNSDRILIIISNSCRPDSSFIERYAVTAKNKRISVFTVSLGMLTKDSIEPLRQFSIIGRGLHFNASYHQRLFDIKGDPVDIFMEAGRLFYSEIHDKRWMEGLFEDNDIKKQSDLEKPVSYLNEIFYDEKKYNITPYTMVKYYPLLASKNIINSSQIEDNIEFIMNKIGNTYVYSTGTLKLKKPLAKVLISDGKTSLWIMIKDDKDLDFFKKQETVNFLFPLGVIIQKNANEPYGITFNYSYITDIPEEYIPGILMTSLNSIIEKPEHYMNQGLFTPPTWFVKVKVERVETFTPQKDIRD